MLQLRQNAGDGTVNAGNYGQRVRKQLAGRIGGGTETACFYELQPGSYLVIPCTSQSGVEMKFLLRIFTDVEISVGYERN